MATPRGSHTATLLLDGRVLVAGGVNEGMAISAELYDPDSGSWAVTGPMVKFRMGPTATLLPDGRVLVAGGDIGDSVISAELYDPASGSWTATGKMVTPRFGHTATLLPDGRVLAAGGYNHCECTADSSTGDALAAAELYDPRSGSWTATVAMMEARVGHTATLLPGGMVLVAGIYADSDLPLSAELYDPANGSWIATGRMVKGREGHTATLLSDGRVLVAGGGRINSGDSELLAHAELYDPGSRSWRATGEMIAARHGYTATLRLDGTVLVTGGDLMARSAELYDPNIGRWTATVRKEKGRVGHSATLLPDGMVLVAGGFDGNVDQLDVAWLASAELFGSPRQ